MNRVSLDACFKDFPYDEIWYFPYGTNSNSLNRMIRLQDY